MWGGVDACGRLDTHTILYCEHHERYLWTRLPMDLYESMRVRMDGWNPRTLWGDRERLDVGRRRLSSGVDEARR